ncbi:ABC-type antimicrobial peptide transport system permease subunit [Pelomonas aquatica]|uniref:ABC-type antimicrobial peptide transport system permease subunit n=1 Tax=Pelomonas aquatica TaxID=431058 RepID=A0ABU1ZFT8_9BURK|nr:FtsX-like permease family protein [Pelomonas aquatica]MDR7298815.1 ABC-type antimicrobial peptide transport system permease subunit [Pelomonas aquatica]
MNLLSTTLWRGAWRQLRAEPGPAALVIAGLALGLALTLLTVGFLRDVLWRHAHLPEADRLIAFEWKTRSPGGGHSDWLSHVPNTPLSRALRDTGAPVGAMSRVISLPLLSRAVDAQGATHHARLTTALVDPDFEALFGVRPIAGDLKAALTAPEGIALTEVGANKLFGTTQVVGKPVSALITVDGDNGQPQSVELTLTVMAVLPSASLNSSVIYEALAGFNAPPAKAYVERASMWTWGNGHLYARLQPGATAAQVGALADRLLQSQPVPKGLPADFLKGGGSFATLRALPVADLGLHGAGSGQRRLQLGSLAAAAAGVLALAVINFINLWSVRTLRRQREIGLRKSLGAGAPALAVQFFIEALAVAGLAGALGLLLAWWGTPPLSALLQHFFEAPVLAPGMVALTGLLCVLIAALSALPLTHIALRVRPAESLAGRSHSEGAASRWLRRLMTTVQFGAAALFTAMALTVAWQSRHVADMPRGFEVENRLAVDLPWETRPAQTTALLARIQAWPEVVAAAASEDVPGRDFGDWYIDYTGPSGQALALRNGANFTPGYLDVYGMHLLAGRLSADHRAEVAQHGGVLDRSAVRALGFASPEAAIGQTILDDGKPVTVVAVIEDIRVEGPRSQAMPHILVPVTERGAGVISVHTRNPAETRRKLTELVNQTLPDAQAQAQVLSVREQQARKMAEDVRLGQLIAITGALALLLAAVGIYALAAYTLRRREREIVLRKLHGAGAGAVARLLVKEFAGVLLAACAVALPLAAWVTQLYLSGFVVRAPVGPGSLWVLLAALALLAVVTAVAVARHLRAALALRPLQALRG